MPVLFVVVVPSVVPVVSTSEEPAESVVCSECVSVCESLVPVWLLTDQLPLLVELDEWPVLFPVESLWPLLRL